MDSPFFQIKVAQEPDSWTVSLSGEVDYAASLQLMPTLEEIAEKCTRELRFDLSQVTLIDSEGVKLLMKAARRMPGRVRVTHCSKSAKRVLCLIGVDELLGMRPERLARNDFLSYE